MITITVIHLPQKKWYFGNNTRKTLIYPVDSIHTSCATHLWRNRKPRAATGDTERGNLQELKQPHGRSNPLYPVRFIYVLYHFVYKKLSIPLILYYFHLQLFHLLSPVYNIISSVPFHLCYVGQSSILAFLSRIISCLFSKSYHILDKSVSLYVI
jgi:hypothetical protein